MVLESNLTFLQETQKYLDNRSTSGTPIVLQIGTLCTVSATTHTFHSPLQARLRFHFCNLLVVLFVHIRPVKVSW